MKQPLLSKLFCLALFTAALVAGCKKDEEATGPLPAPAMPPLRQLFADHRAQAVQHFTVEADNGPAAITGTGGVYVHFAQHAFRKADGSVATGPVSVGLVEALHVGDMLWLNTQTVGLQNGQPKLLVSGGQFRLTAEQGGEPLTLAPGAAYVSVPTSQPDPSMALFSGTVQADGTMLWNPWVTNPLAPGFDSANYSFPNDSLGWINCDYFYGGGQSLTPLHATCPPGYNPENAFVWLVFPGINSLTNLVGGTGSTFSTGNGYEVPVGLPVTVVALAYVDEQYYSSFTEAVVSDGLDVPITLAPTTLAEFQAQAGQL